MYVCHYYLPILARYIGINGLKWCMTSVKQRVVYVSSSAPKILYQLGPTYDDSQWAKVFALWDENS